MRVSELIERLKAVPGDATLCVAELEEAFAANVAAVETVRDARIDRLDADGTETVELGGGNEVAVVIRW
ncbi:MAG TPA: sugar phosphorylase [Devosia sp.]|jgi:hypothetical protein|nr:sugar phosphorylase [Devosia sp.]